MEASVRDELIAEWHRNEKELATLQDLPVGADDPATREAALERRQDAIEFALGDHRETLIERRASNLDSPP